MPERSSRSLLAAASAGLFIIAAATAAHLAAGGAVDIYALTGLAALSVALSTTLASRVRLTFVRAVTVALLLQPVMHRMLGHGAGVASDATGHAQHGMAMPGQGAHVASSMLAIHAAVALACAVILRWGVRWLRSMPTIGRALVVWTRGVAVPVTLPCVRAPAVRHTVGTPLAILFAWDNRGSAALNRSSIDRLRWRIGRARFRNLTEGLSMNISSRARRVGVALIATVGFALVPALPAFAHVSVSSPDAAPGGFGKVVFRVPNESDTANTTALSVTLPSDTPFPFVSVGAVPGWTATTTTSTLPEPIEVEGFTVTEAVTNVTWTADGDGLPPEQFAEFALSVGPFPDGVDQLVFPATQTYSDGEVVNWSDPSVEGEAEPEHPAPVLTIEASADSEDSGDSDSTDTFARILGVAGIALGATGIAFGARNRRTAQASS